jgi:hypothetical protein
MKESEQGGFVRYDEHKEEIERLRMERDSYRRMYNDLRDAHCAMFKNYHDEQKLSDHLRLRVGILFTVLMAVMGMVVGKLIVWSLGIL